jgi:hypothetical protein
MEKKCMKRRSKSASKISIGKDAKPPKKDRKSQIHRVYRKLERPLFHGTSCRNLSSILLLGLESERTPVHRETLNPDEDYAEERAFERGVYMVEDIQDAVSYSYDASKDCDPEDLERCSADEEKMCVIEIFQLPEEVEIGSDGYGGLMSNDSIPSECLKVWRPEDLRKKFGVNNLLDLV